jgi:hypothetical protein
MDEKCQPTTEGAETPHCSPPIETTEIVDTTPQPKPATKDQLEEVQKEMNTFGQSNDVFGIHALTVNITHAILLLPHF